MFLTCSRTFFNVQNYREIDLDLSRWFPPAPFVVEGFWALVYGIRAPWPFLLLSDRFLFSGKWSFPWMGVALVIIHVKRIFPYKPSSYWDSPMTIAGNPQIPFPESGRASSKMAGVRGCGGLRQVPWIIEKGIPKITVSPWVARGPSPNAWFFVPTLVRLD